MSDADHPADQPAPKPRARKRRAAARADDDPVDATPPDPIVERRRLERLRSRLQRKYHGPSSVSSRNRI